MSRRTRRSAKRAIEQYFPGDDLAQNVWEDKYKATGEYDPSDMHMRMAKEFARIEFQYKETEEYSKDLSDFGKKLWKDRVVQDYDQIVDLIYDDFDHFKKIVPQGSVMSQLGNTEAIGSLSNCFVIGQPEDSYGGILYKDQELVQLMKRRGGVGIDISTLRPRGTIVSNAASTSTGAASFMERFSNSTREVAQGGRRGALMLSIDVRHPDVLEFINAKKDRSKVTGANISIMLRDDFMEAVKNDGDYFLRFPCDAIQLASDPRVIAFQTLDEENGEFLSKDDMTYGVSYGRGPIKITKVKAKEIYDAIVENAHENAEPGQIFIDKHHSYSPDGVYEQYRGVTTNPCGEIFMQAYDACRLMALNFRGFVVNPYTEHANVDGDELYRAAYMQQRLADNLVDLELEHIIRIINKLRRDPESVESKTTEISLWEKIYEVASAGRRTGCGFTALGDTLAALGIPYDSKEALTFTERIMRIKMRAELDASIDMAITRGRFKDCQPGKEYEGDLGMNSFYKMVHDDFPEQYQRMRHHGRRNISWSTVAPTGSVSILTQTTSGLEPLFSPYYMRRKKIQTNNPDEVDFWDDKGDQWKEFPVLHHEFKEWLLTQDVGSDVNLLTKDELDVLFAGSPWYKSTANDIDWKSRVELQAVIQKYTSHSISSTINLPKSATKKDVAEIYMHAFDTGLKGVTVYRDGSRDGVLVTEPAKTTFESKDAVKRPDELPCDIYNVVAKGKKWTVIIGTIDGKPYEVFAIEGHEIKETPGLLVKVKRGVYNVITDKAVYENVTAGMSAEEEAITRLTSTCLRHGADTAFIVEQLDKSHGDITSFGKALSRTLKKYVSDETLQARSSPCPNCDEGELVYEEGCKQCKSCGYSAC